MFSKYSYFVLQIDSYHILKYYITFPPITNRLFTRFLCRLSGPSTWLLTQNPPGTLPIHPFALLRLILNPSRYHCETAAVYSRQAETTTMTIIILIILATCFRVQGSDSKIASSPPSCRNPYVRSYWKTWKHLLPTHPPKRDKQSLSNKMVFFTKVKQRGCCLRVGFLGLSTPVHSNKKIQGGSSYSHLLDNF